MKKIILSLLTVFVLFSCQNEMDIEPEFTTDSINVKSGIWPEYELFNRLCVKFKKELGYPNLIPLTDSEYHNLSVRATIMYAYYPIMQKFTNDLLMKNVTIKVGRDISLFDEDGYYHPYKNSIFFHKKLDIQEYHILHELLHAVQHHIFGYSMNSNAVKNIEYEAHVARDLLECIRRNGQFEFAGAMGVPNYELRMEYKAWIEELSICALTGKDFEGILRGKFNTWTKDWKSYTDKSWDSKFFPYLLYHIIRNTERWN